MRRDPGPRRGHIKSGVTSMSGIAPGSDVPVIAFGSPASPSRQRMSAVAGWFRWRTTPDRIRGMAAVTMIVAVLLGLITAVAFTSIAAGLRLIGQQAEPEVLATTDLYFRLNDMDAQVANVLLVGGQRGLGIDRQQAQAIYEQDRRHAPSLTTSAATRPWRERPCTSTARARVSPEGRRSRRSFSTGRPRTC